VKLDVVSELTGLPINFDTVMEIFLECSTIKETIRRRSGVVDNKFMFAR